MAEAVWKARLRERVMGANIPIRDADAELRAVNALFTSPVSLEAKRPGTLARVATLRGLYTVALEWLTEVSHHLNSAVVHMEAAEILALHGGKLIDPAVPFPNVEYLAQPEPAVYAAMSRLHMGRVMAVDAYKVVGWCRGHLSSAITLVTVPGIPYAHHFIEWECATAMNALAGAIERTQAALGDFASALPLLAPPP